MNVAEMHIDLEILLARQVIASSLAASLADPRSVLARRCDEADGRIIASAWDVMRETFEKSEMVELGGGERRPGDVDVSPVAEWLATSASERERAHQEVFGLVMTKLCPCYETEYCSWKDATHRAQEMADIGGFYRAFGLKPGRRSPERMDHVSVEIEYIAFLLEKERRERAKGDAGTERAAICHDARTGVLTDHASWWMPTFGRLLERRVEEMRERRRGSSAGFQMMSGVARFLCAWVAWERTAAGVAPSRRLISPSVAPQEVDDECGTCGGCASDAAG